MSNDYEAAAREFLRLHKETIVRRLRFSGQSSEEIANDLVQQLKLDPRVAARVVQIAEQSAFRSVRKENQFVAIIQVLFGITMMLVGWYVIPEINDLRNFPLDLGEWIFGIGLVSMFWGIIELLQGFLRRRR